MASTEKKSENINPANLLEQKKMLINNLIETLNSMASKSKNDQYKKCIKDIIGGISDSLALMNQSLSGVLEFFNEMKSTLNSEWCRSWLSFFIKPKLPKEAFDAANDAYNLFINAFQYKIVRICEIDSVNERKNGL